MFGRAEPELYELANRAYDLGAVCAPDFAHVQDGTRREGTYRDQKHAWYLDELTKRNVPFVVIGGSLDARVDELSARIDAMLAKDARSRN